MARKEVWLREEDIPNMSPMLQPAANALLEAAEELASFLADFPQSKLWEKPAGCASVGFHLLHISGFLDRLLTYADGNMLSEKQLIYLQSENEINTADLQTLQSNTLQSISKAVEKLKTYPDATLTEIRFVGRNKIKSTVIGLIFHSAEHTMRHIGQLLVTTSILKSL
ncbi:MAG: DinB family protein [Pseudopedobacter saltans]|uniref:DinB family protein n=1 Tax=Pseudopedobacter saltans TaxID=151895 RepID=A0A2W5EVL1_9SPHI|nr:MAG: DinB family protein [Pseudopedobacter saltans]